jgi:hypothetical protein
VKQKTHMTNVLSTILLLLVVIALISGILMLVT